MATLTECGICLEDFKQPKLLPCSHTFCLKCLQRHTSKVAGTVFHCPTCRAEIQTPKRGLQSFPDNQHAEELIAVKKNSRKMSKSPHDTSSSERKCSSSSSDGGAVSDDSQEMCPTHNQPLTVYCKKPTCEVALCVRCFMMKHKDHEVADICDVADDAKLQLRKLKQKCADVIQNWKEHEDALLKSETSLNNKVSRAVENIEKTKHDLFQEIEKTAKEVEAKITQRHLEQLQEIERVKSKLAYSKESFEELQDIMQDLIENNNPTEITKNLSLMRQNYDHLCQKDTKKLDVTTKVRALTFERADIVHFADVVFGKVREENLTVVPVHPATEENRSVTSPDPLSRQHSTLERQNSVPKATLHSRWDTNLSRYGALGVSEDGEVTVAGHDGKSWRIKQYRLSGECVWYTKTSQLHMSQISGICYLTTAYRKYIALSDSNKVNLLDMNRKVVSTFQKPTISPETLCSFTDEQTKKIILMVNTSTKLPQCHLEAFLFNDSDRIADSGRTIDTGVYNVYGLCVYQYKGKQLVAMASSRMLLAIDLKTGQVQWRIDDKYDGRQLDPHDICSDGAGHLYIADGSNKRVLVASDSGRILRTLTRSPGKSWAIRWVHAHSKLLHLYEEVKTAKISVFKVNL